MRALRELVELVDAHARYVLVQARRGFRDGDAAIDHVDDTDGAVVCEFALSRYCELVTANRGRS